MSSIRVGMSRNLPARHVCPPVGVGDVGARVSWTLKLTGRVKPAWRARRRLRAPARHSLRRRPDDEGPKSPSRGSQRSHPSRQPPALRMPRARPSFEARDAVNSGHRCAPPGEPPATPSCRDRWAPDGARVRPPCNASTSRCARRHGTTHGHHSPCDRVEKAAPRGLGRVPAPMYESGSADVGS